MSVYALTDLHGRKDLWDLANHQLFKSDDTIYFLGDAIDRGPDGYELMTTLLADPRVIYLKGNHEDMLAAAIDDYLFESGENDCEFYICNEGEQTWQAWRKAGEHNITPILDNLPEFKIYINKNGQKIFLSHAGCNPWQASWNLLWDRTHFLTRYWRNNHIADIIVHGHTPIPFLYTPHKTWEEETAFWYCNNHKVDLDSYAYGTGVLMILNLDTFNTHIIKGRALYDYIEWSD